MKYLKQGVLWCIGGTLYTCLEFLWRGYSHSSMFAAGGLCFLLVGRLDENRPRLPRLVRTVLGAGIITAVELVFGLLVNRDYRVWDYRELPANFLGQICLPYSLLWIPVSSAAARSYRFFSSLIKLRPGTIQKERV